MLSVSWQWFWVTPNTQTTPISTFCVTFRIFVVGEYRLKIWYTGWLYLVPFYRQQTIPEGAWLRHMTDIKFFALYSYLRNGWYWSCQFCTQKDLFCQRDDKSPPPQKKRRASAHVTSFCMCISVFWRMSPWNAVVRTTMPSMVGLYCSHLWQSMPVMQYSEVQAPLVWFVTVFVENVLV